jgi:hypothetical protein
MDYLASGVSPCLATAASEAMMTAPAPSQMPEADPAVTTPPRKFFLKNKYLCDNWNTIFGMLYAIVIVKLELEIFRMIRVLQFKRVNFKVILLMTKLQFSGNTASVNGSLYLS